LSSQSCLYLGPMVVASGMARFKFVFSLSVLDSLYLETPPALRFFAQLKPSPTTSDFLHSDVLFSPQVAGHSGSVLVISSVSCPDVSSIALGIVSAESPSLLRSTAKLGAAMSASDSVHLSFVSTSRALGHLGPLMLVLDFVHVGIVLPLQFPAWLDAGPAAFSHVRVGPVSIILEFAQSRPPPTLRNCSCLSVSLSALDLLHLGASLSSHFLAHPDAAITALRLAYPGLVFSLLVMDTTRLEALPSFKSSARSEFSPPVFELVSADTSISLRSPLWLSNSVALSNFVTSGVMSSSQFSA